MAHTVAITLILTLGHRLVVRNWFLGRAKRLGRCEVGLGLLGRVNAIVVACATVVDVGYDWWRSAGWVHRRHLTNTEATLLVTACLWGWQDTALSVTVSFNTFEELLRISHFAARSDVDLGDRLHQVLWVYIWQHALRLLIVSALTSWCRCCILAQVRLWGSTAQ